MVFNRHVATGRDALYTRKESLIVILSSLVSRATVFASVVFAVGACSSDPVNTPDASTPADTGAISGEMLTNMFGCVGCHTDMAPGSPRLAGQTVPRNGTTTVFSPNLTPDMTTGLGSWTEMQIATAILDGTDNGGRALCRQMPRYRTNPLGSLTQDQALAIARYLKSLPAVSRMITASTCP